MRETTNRLEQALELYTLGYHVIPLCGPDHTCESPGKAPHLSGWTRFADDQSQDDIIRLFQRHSGNIGIAPQRHQLVIDVDPRAGGAESWKRLCEDLDIYELETPHVFTGGGGEHWYMSLPAGTKLPAGSSLERAGYPGVEWKTHHGQVVAPPSAHASGGTYSWEIALEPDLVEPMEIPAQLLDLILQVRDGFFELPGRPKARRKDDGVRGQKWTRAEKLAFFALDYSEGERRTPSGLPRLIGILGRQHVCQSCAVRFLTWWERSHFNPPLGADIVSQHVVKMYGRYGYDGSHCDHERLAFLNDATAIAIGNPKSPVTQQAAAELVEQAAAERDKETRRQRSEAQNKALYGARSTFRPATATGKSAEFPPLHTIVGGELCISGADSPVLMHDPTSYLPKDRMEVLIQDLEGKDSKRAQNLHECAWVVKMNCSNHGERFRSRKTCNWWGHATCPTEVGEKVRQVELPDLSGDERYREVWLLLPVSTPAGSPQADQTAIQRVMKTYQAVISKASRRRSYAGRVMHRAVAFYLKRPFSFVFLKFMVREDVAGDCDGLVELVRSEMGAGFLAEKDFQAGTDAVTQLYEDSMTNLVGMHNEDDVNLFHSWFLAMKGHKWWQGMSSLWEALKEVKRDEPARCDICHERLSSITVDPKIEEALRRDADVASHGPPAYQYGLEAAD